MTLPTLAQPADRSWSSVTAAYAHAGDFSADGVSPQLRVCTPCIRLGGGRHCVNLGPFGRRCFSIPSLGRWRLCCRTRFGWPPVSCGVERCG